MIGDYHERTLPRDTPERGRIELGADAEHLDGVVPQRGIAVIEPAVGVVLALQPALAGEDLGEADREALGAAQGARRHRTRVIGRHSSCPVVADPCGAAFAVPASALRGAQ